MTHACGAALIAALGMAGCAPPPAADVDRLDVRLVLRDDGSVEAEERLRVRVGGDSFTLRRPLDRHDAIVDVEAKGQPAEVTPGGGLDVEWHLPGAGTYDLEVRYRAIGVVAVRGGHAALSWPIVHARRSFGPTAVDLALTLPADTQLSAAPYVEDGPGWTVTRDGSVIRAWTREAAAGGGAALVVPFFVDPNAIDEPIWQRDATRGRDLLPAFISAALFILVIAIGALVMIRVQYPRRRGAPPDAGRAAVARGLRLAGAVTVVVGLLAVPLTEWGLGRYGPWAHAIPLSVVAGGIAFVVYGARREI